MKLVDLRTAAGLTQCQAASLIGVAQCCVSSWENGASKPTVDKIPKITAAYHCTCDDVVNAIMEGTGNERANG